MTLDEMDISILNAMDTIGCKPRHKLSDVVGISTSALSRRIQRLEDIGVIQGYGVKIDYSKYAYTVRAFVNVKVLGGICDLDAFENLIVSLPGKIECYTTIGIDDYSLHVMARNNKVFHEDILNVIRAFPGVRGVRVNLIMHDIKTPRLSKSKSDNETRPV